MDLYVALQTIHNKVVDVSTDAKYCGDSSEMMKAILENQVRLGEAVLVIGSLLSLLADQKVDVVINPPKGSSTH